MRRPKKRNEMDKAFEETFGPGTSLRQGCTVAFAKNVLYVVFVLGIIMVLYLIFSD